jgi:hypothetical protein
MRRLQACSPKPRGLAVEEVMSLYISVAFKADVDEKAAVITGSKVVEDTSEAGVSDITTYTWTIER